jgi:hypothetical protein
MMMHWKLRTIAFVVAIGSSAFGGPAQAAGVASCAAGVAAAECGTCCYEPLGECCQANGCVEECYLITSWCCPGGYQLDHC